MLHFSNPAPRKIIVTGLSILFIAVLAACSETGSSDQAGTTELTQAQKDSAAEAAKKNAMKAEDLTAAYVANGVKAEQTYKGKTLTVVGKIEQIDKDIEDKNFVALTGHREGNGVKCRVSEEAAAQLKKGMTVTIKGTVDDFYMVVTMNDCEVISASN